MQLTKYYAADGIMEKEASITDNDLDFQENDTDRNRKKYIVLNEAHESILFGSERDSIPSRKCCDKLHCAKERQTLWNQVSIVMILLSVARAGATRSIVLIPPENYTVFQNDIPAIFYCYGNGFGTGAAVTWTLNGTGYGPEHAQRGITVSTHTPTEATISSNLSFPSNSAINNNTQVVCRTADVTFTNTMMSVPANLTIQGPLDAPNSFSVNVSNISNTTLLLSWGAPFSLDVTNSPDIFYYILCANITIYGCRTTPNDPDCTFPKMCTSSVDFPDPSLNGGQKKTIMDYGDPIEFTFFAVNGAGSGVPKLYLFQPQKRDTNIAASPVETTFRSFSISSTSPLANNTQSNNFSEAVWIAIGLCCILIAACVLIKIAKNCLNFNTMSVEKYLTYPCLGRTMELGMLYDCRNESIVSGMTLWDKEKLRSNTDIKPRKQMMTNFSISTEDSLDSKCRSLGINANLKLSFLAGMVSQQLQGSGKYLTSKKTSKNEARVVLEYHSTQHFEQLSMEHLAHKNIQYPEVFKKCSATHIVTGVEYGADAFFEFRCTAETVDECKRAEGSLQLAVKTKLNCYISGKGEVEGTEDNMKTATKFNCTYYGDMCFPTNPTTFEQAMDLCKNIESHLKSNSRENGIVGVPKTVYLYPLCELNSKASTVHSIKEEVISECSNIIEIYNNFCQEVKALQTSSIYDTFPAIKTQLEDFCGSISTLLSNLQSTWQISLPKIRGGTLDESKLTEKIHKLKSSPFDKGRLERWINAKVTEKQHLEAIHLSLNNSIPNLIYVVSQFDLACLSFGNSAALCYSFGEDVSSDTHPFLKELKSWNSFEGSTVDDNVKSWEPGNEWYDSQFRYGLEQLNQFTTFAKNNKEQSKVKFAAIVSSETKKEGRIGALYICIGAELRPFQLPLQPASPKILSVKHDSMTICWDPPENGSKNIASYVVSYCAKDGKSKSMPAELTQGTKETPFLLTNLLSNTSYNVCVAAVCEIGIGMPSEPATINTQMAPPQNNKGKDEECIVM